MGKTKKIADGRKQPGKDQDSKKLQENKSLSKEQLKQQSNGRDDKQHFGRKPVSKDKASQQAGAVASSNQPPLVQAVDDDDRTQMLIDLGLLRANEVHTLSSQVKTKKIPEISLEDIEAHRGSNRMKESRFGQLYSTNTPAVSDWSGFAHKEADELTSTHPEDPRELSGQVHRANQVQHFGKVALECDGTRPGGHHGNRSNTREGRGGSILAGQQNQRTVSQQQESNRDVLPINFKGKKSETYNNLDDGNQAGRNVTTRRPGRALPQATHSWGSDNPAVGSRVFVGFHGGMLGSKKSLLANTITHESSIGSLKDQQRIASGTSVTIDPVTRATVDSSTDRNCHTHAHPRQVISEMKNQLSSSTASKQAQNLTEKHTSMYSRAQLMALRPDPSAAPREVAVVSQQLRQCERHRSLIIWNLPSWRVLWALLGWVLCKVEIVRMYKQGLRTSYHVTFPTSDEAQRVLEILQSIFESSSETLLDLSDDPKFCLDDGRDLGLAMEACASPRESEKIIHGQNELIIHGHGRQSVSLMMQPAPNVLKPPFGMSEDARVLVAGYVHHGDAVRAFIRAKYDLGPCVTWYAASDEFLLLLPSLRAERLALVPKCDDRLDDTLRHQATCDFLAHRWPLTPTLQQIGRTSEHFDVQVKLNRSPRSAKRMGDHKMEDLISFDSPSEASEDDGRTEYSHIQSEGLLKEKIDDDTKNLRTLQVTGQIRRQHALGLDSSRFAPRASATSILEQFETSKTSATTLPKAKSKHIAKDQETEIGPKVESQPQSEPKPEPEPDYALMLRNAVISKPPQPQDRFIDNQRKHGS